MAAMDSVEKNSIKQTFGEFMTHVGLDDAVRDMVDKQGKRLIVNMNDLREFDADFARGVLARPSQYLPAFEEVVREQAAHDSPKEAEHSEYFVGIDGSFGAQQVSPRGLLCHLLNRLVSVEGIVTRCSSVHPKVVQTVHHCKKTGEFTTRDYRDITATAGMPTTTAYPTKTAAGELLTTEYGLCTYRDHQIVSLQEMPERAPPGQLPRSIDVMVENELVDKCRPGDRVRMSGIFRALPAKQSSTGMYRTLVLGNHVRLLSKEAMAEGPNETDVRNIRKLAKSKELLPEFVRSLAPSVYGHDDVKQALLLMLLGGVEKNLQNGTHLRGDINVLMVGDPSTAKSQILRFALGIAPLAISTTGRGSSGVGLTAAVTTDSETGERRLEAGAMVLADRGVCCIDEFDKMLEADRTAIHEVMEQQTITIAKAGIHASLNARASVLAAANPVYGKYNRDHSPMENIGLPDSLLSRFDLLFIVLDPRSVETDRAISGHVLQMHRTSKTGATPAALSAFGGRGGDVVEDRDEEDDHAGASDASGQTPMYVKFERGTLQTGPGGRRGRGKVTQTVLSTAFIKKYIRYAKQRVAPTMGAEACARIATEYANLRQRAAGTEMRCLPITPRTLETMIRLSTAFAKLHLRGTVLEEDVACAIEIMHNALFKEIPKDKKGGGKSGGAADGGDGDEEDGADDGNDGGDEGARAAPLGSPAVSSEGDKENRARKRASPRASAGAAGAGGAGSGKKARRAAAAESDEDEEGGADEDEEGAAAPGRAGSSRARAAASPPAASEEGPTLQDEEPAVPLESLPAGTLERLKVAVGNLSQRNHGEDSFPIAMVFAALADENTAANLPEPTMGELRAALSHPDMESTLMYEGGTVYVLS